MSNEDTISLMVDGIRKDFRYHPATNLIGLLHERVRKLLEGTALELATTIVPTGRELSVALIKLEEAMFWANAGIARAQREEKELSQ